MRRLTVVSALLAAVVGLSACGPTLTSLPLPGSGVSGSTITVNADFGNALNLAQGAAVSINGVLSGRVQSVSAADFTAHVTMLVQRAADLRSNATIRLRYTTPLGELYVEVTNPSSGPLMQDNGTLGLPSTSTAPTVEDALASASLLINGGGLNQLQTIVSEANKALGGHEGSIRSLVTDAASAESQMYAAGGDITSTLNALDAVSESVASRRNIIHRALVEIAPAARALHANTGNLTELLAGLSRFSGTANRVVDANKASLLTIVRRAQPLLQEIVAVRGQLAPSLNAILSLSKSLNRIVPGDYVNLFLILDVATPGPSRSGAGTARSGTGSRPAGRTSKSGGAGGLSSIPIIGGLL